MPDRPPIDALAVQGAWWLPDRPDRKLQGALLLEDGDFDLMLDGSLFPPEIRPGEVVGVRPEWKTISMVHGRSRDRVPVTLLGCEGLVTAVPDIPSVHTTESYTPRAALVGRHMDEVPMFAEASIEFDVLAPWADAPSLLVECSSVPEGATLGPRKQVLEMAELPWGAASVVAWAVGTMGPKRVHLARVVTMELSFKGGASLEGILQDFVRPFADLFTLMTLRPARLTTIKLRAVGQTERDPSMSLHLPLVQARPSTRPTHSEALHPERALSTRRRPLLPFADLVPRWLELHRRLQVSVGALVLPERSPFLYDENRFLAAFWSAESLHSKLFESQQVPEVEHEARVRSVVDAAMAAGVDEEVIAWARSVLASRNEKTLRQKLGDLIRFTGEVGRRVVEAEPTFIGKLTGTRGPLAHSGSGGRLETPGRYFHGEALRWMVRACLLQELGVDPEYAQRLIVTREQFTWVLSHLRDEP